MIAVAGREPYLRCKWTNGDEVWRLPIKEIHARPEKYLCTTDESYAEAWKYRQALERWITNWCR